MRSKAKTFEVTITPFEHKFSKICKNTKRFQGKPQKNIKNICFFVVDFQKNIKNIRFFFQIFFRKGFVFEQYIIIYK